MQCILEFYKEGSKKLTDDEKKLLHNRDNVHYDPEPLDNLIEETGLQIIMVETEDDDLVIPVFIRDGWTQL